MRRLGYPALSPILNGYDWPSNKLLVPAPFEHQRHMSAFMTLHPHCFNLSDMGTGKTLSTLWAYDYLMTLGIVKKALILAPLSALRRTWENEIFTHFLSNRRCSILYGDERKRLRALDEDVDFYIINHDGLAVGHRREARGVVLGRLGEEIRSREDINAICVDEGSVYKDSGTLRYKILRKIVSDKPYLWWLTGTPVPVEPPNAWSQAKLVRQDYNESYKGFQERTMNKITTFKYIPKKDGYQSASEILQPAIRYSRDECLDLPDVMVQDYDAELSVPQKQAIETLKKELRVMVGSGTITAINEASLRMKLIQIACGAVYGEGKSINKIDCSSRLNVLKEIVENAKHKILIFAPLTSVVDMLYLELQKEGYNVERINGPVSPKKRDEVFSRFQDRADPLRIIVADPGTMSHSLTLTEADTTLWYAPTDKPEVYQQANKRMDRPGQRNRMLVGRISSTRTEREIYKRLDNRGSLQGLMLDLIGE